MRRFEHYKVRRADNLGDPDFWNKRFEDLDLRLAAAEQTGGKIDGAVAEIQSVALQRLNDTLTPIINEALDRLASVGALFEADSASEVEVGLGEKTFVLTENTRTGYVVTDYVVIRAVDDEGATIAALIAQTLDYDRAAGLLTVDVTLADGEGTYDLWQIRISAPPDIEHATRTDNPHDTTAGQVGAYTTAEVDAIAGTLAAAIAGKAAAADLAAAVAAIEGKQASAEKGQPNGYAALGADGKVPTGQLPASGGVSSFNGRAGAVSPAADDYAIADITGLSAALAGKQASAEKGQPNGYASLGADGKVPAGQLPAAGIATASNGLVVSGSDVRINTDNAGGIGSYCAAMTGAFIGAGATIAGSNLSCGGFSPSGSWSGGGSLSGTWRNMSGSALNASQSGLFLRIS